MPRRVVTTDEQDAFTGWRRYLHWRPGQIAAIKRRAHKRDRREAAADIVTQWRGGTLTPEVEYCPRHGNTLQYHPDQRSPMGDLELREHLECSVDDCGYETWA